MFQSAAPQCVLSDFNDSMMSPLASPSGQTARLPPSMFRADKSSGWADCQLSLMKSVCSTNELWVNADSWEARRLTEVLQCGRGLSVMWRSEKNLDLSDSFSHTSVNQLFVSFHIKQKLKLHFLFVSWWRRHTEPISSHISFMLKSLTDKHEHVFSCTLACWMSHKYSEIKC